MKSQDTLIFQKKWAAGVNMSLANYFGDISPGEGLNSIDYNSTRYMVGLSTTYSVNSLLKARLDANYIRIQATDKNVINPTEKKNSFRYLRNLNFRNDIFEILALGELSLFKFKYIKRKTYPYLASGISAFYHNPEGKFK